MYMYVCMYVCIYTYTHTYIHIHTYIYNIYMICSKCCHEHISHYLLICFTIF